jgi:hypothetical protein
VISQAFAFNQIMRKSMTIILSAVLLSILYQAAFKKITRRQGRGDEGVHNKYVEKPTTQPTQLAFECSLVLEVNEYD